MAENKVLVVHVDEKHRTAGLFEGSKLVEVFLEHGDEKGLVGSIFLGRVVRVVPSMQAAFVDIGIGRDGFLSGDDAGYANDGDGDRKRKIEQVIRRNQLILVQVLKDPVADKGCQLTSDISLPGRYLVLKPFDKRRGVSRNIPSADERKRLLELAEAFVPKEHGVIIRTAAKDISKREFRADFKYLLRTWQEIMKGRKAAAGPVLLHEDLDLVQRALRDNYTAGEFEQVIVDDRRERRMILRFLKSISPRGQWDRKVVTFNKRASLEETYGLRREIARALERRVWLECGGYLIIEEMETLTAIDVNTGRNIRGDKQRDTIVQTNVEAAAEVARQLRLRAIGGIVVIDFIDMDRKSDQRKVESALRQALRKDKAASDVFFYPDVGLVHLTRQRTRTSLSRQLTIECPTCQGNAVIPKNVLLRG